MPKIGRNIVDLAQEIQRQAETKRDFLAESTALELQPVEEGFTLHMRNGNGGLSFAPNDLFHEQLSAKLGVPRAYYDRMRTHAPELLSRNVNHWLHSEPNKQMVRTLDGRARAFLSDRYRPLDNIDMAEAVLPQLARLKAEIVSAELTERRLYLKAVVHDIRADIRVNRGGVQVGDVVEAGVVVANSEVGCGAVSIDPYSLVLSCLNGAVMRAMGLRKYHVGRGHRDSDIFTDGAAEFYCDETRELDDRAFWSKVVDVVKATLTPERFQAMVAKMQAAADAPIQRDPIEFIEVLTKQMPLTETDGRSILTHLIQGGDLSQWGAAQAITRYSQDIADYDKATEFERLGGQIIELPKSAWAVLAGSRN